MPYQRKYFGSAKLAVATNIKARDIRTSSVFRYLMRRGDQSYSNIVIQLRNLSVLYVLSFLPLDVTTLWLDFHVQPFLLSGVCLTSTGNHCSLLFQKPDLCKATYIHIRHGWCGLALPCKKAKPSSKYKVTCTTMQQQYRGYILLKH